MCCGKLKKTARTVQNIAKGYTYLAMGTNELLSQSRLRLCNNCPHLVGGIACNICGCAVNAKSRVPEEYCPDGRWPAQTESI